MLLNISLSDLTCFPMAAVLSVSPWWINTRLICTTVRQLILPWGKTDRLQEVEGVLSACTVHSPSLGCVHMHTSLTHTLILLCSTGLHRSTYSSWDEYLPLLQAGTKLIAPHSAIKISQKGVGFLITGSDSGAFMHVKRQTFVKMCV